MITITVLRFFEVVQQGYLVGLIWGLRLWGSELSGRGSRARWVRAALSDHIINDTHDGICDIYVISSNMAIYGNDEKPGQHCIGSMGSAQESCSEMPDAKIIMRRRGCSGCWRDIKWMYNEHISNPTEHYHSWSNAKGKLQLKSRPLFCSRPVWEWVLGCFCKSFANANVSSGRKFAGSSEFQFCASIANAFDHALLHALSLPQNFQNS